MNASDQRGRVACGIRRGGIRRARGTVRCGPAGCPALRDERPGYWLSSALACSLAFFISSSADLPCMIAFTAFGSTFLDCSKSPQPALIGVNLVLVAIC